MAKRIVIADNQKMFTEGVEAILSQIKYPLIKIVGIAYSQEDLMQMLKYPIDLLIIELAMIQDNDFGFIGELKKSSPNTRIIILSSYGDNQLVREVFMKGVDGYVLKSNHSLELIQCIERVLEGETYLAEGLRLSPEFGKTDAKVDEVQGSGLDDRFLLKQKLTKREMEVLGLIVQFKNNKIIGQELYISDQTVSAHRKRIMKKLGVNSTVNLIKFSLDHHLV